MHKSVQHIADSQEAWDTKVESLLGMEVKTWDGNVSTLAGVNDLGVPYFTLPNRKTMFCLKGFGQDWLSEQVARAALIQELRGTP